MTELPESSSNFTPDASADAAIDDIERALERFERVMQRLTPVLTRAASLSTRNSRKRPLVSGLVGGLAALLPQAGRAGSAIVRRNLPDSNRFPVSGGQMFTDLMGALQRFSGRNL